MAFGVPVPGCRLQSSWPSVFPALLKCIRLLLTSIWVSAASFVDAQGQGPPGVPAPARPAKYHWPQPRGRARQYGISPFPGPHNLSSIKPTWNWYHPTSRYHTILVGAPLIDDAINVYVGAVDGVRKFSPDGQLLWTYKVTSPIFAAPSLMAGRVYGSTFSGYFFSVSMETGCEIWSAKVSPHVAMDATSVVAHEGALYACVNLHRSLKGNEKVIALDAKDGSLLWEFWPDAPITNFMAIFAEDGTLVFQDREAVVYRLLCSNGTLLWRAGRHDRASSAAPAIGTSGSMPSPRQPGEPPQPPTLPRRTGLTCPEFPLGNGTVLTLRPAGATAAKERTVRLWRWHDRPGGMVAMWFHRSSFTPLPWARQWLWQPRAALASGVPAAVALVLLCYSGCCLGCGFCCCGRGCACARRHAASWASEPPSAKCLALRLAVLPLVLGGLLQLRAATGEGAAAAYGESAEAILGEGGVVLGFDGDFASVPFYGWHAVAEEGWGEHEDWLVVDEAVACAFERLPSLDPRRVHAAGFSAGGIMAAKVGFMRPQYVASVAPISGSLIPMQNEQWPTPRPRPGVPHRFAAMIVVGGEVDIARGAAWFDRPKPRFSWRVASQFTRDTLLGRGQLAFVCDHGHGHQALPRNMSGYLYRFFKDHPYGVTSPYALQGLPAAFDHSMCEETRGLGLVGGEWHYTCCSASEGDLDPTPYHVSMAHLQMMKRNEGIPDSVIPYMVPDRAPLSFFNKVWRVYGREEPAADPARREGLGVAVIGIYDDDGCKAGGHRSTVGGVIAGPNGVVYAVSTEEDKTGMFHELPGCLHAYGVSDGRLLWQRGLPYRARIRPAVAQLAGQSNLSVIMPSGRDPYITWKMTLLMLGVYGAVFGLLVSLLLGCCRYCCLGGRRFECRRLALGIAFGLAFGFILGLAIVSLWDATYSEVWAIDAQTGKLQWRFKAAAWEHMAAAGDEEGILTRMRLGRLRTDCMPSSWSSPSIDSQGTVFIGHMSGKLFAIHGDMNGDGLIEGEKEVSSFTARAGFPHAGPSLAPGMLAAISCDELLVFKT